MGVGLRQLRYFVALAEELQFSRAARRLNISQPTLSEAIRTLEEEIGNALFERSTRSVTLTSAGTRMLAEARVALAAVERSLAAGAAATSSVEPPLQFGASTAARWGFIEPLLDRYACMYPDAGVAVREQASGALLRDLAGYRLDVCLTYCARPGEGRRSIRLSDEPMLVALAGGDPRVGARDLPLSELSDLPMVLLDGEEYAGFNAVALATCRAHDFSPDLVRMPHGHVTPAFLRTGGFLFVPILAALTRPEGVGFAVPATDATLPFDLIWRDEPLSPALARFLAVALSVARGTPWRRLRATVKLGPEPG